MQSVLGQGERGASSPNMPQNERGLEKRSENQVCGSVEN
jgi:hypothetical protein